MVGRLSYYKDTFPDQVYKYIDEQIYKEEGDVIPTMEGVARHLGISMSMLKRYRIRNEEFGLACDYLATEKMRLLQNGSLKGSYQAAPSIFLMKCAGYREDQLEDEKSTVLSDDELLENIKSILSSKAKNKDSDA